MDILKDITEDEMISAFLQAKMGSSRFLAQMQKIFKKYEVNQNIIDNPNLDSIEENKVRRKAAMDFGGSDGNGGLFESLPKDIVWKRVILTKDELTKVRYIDYDYRNELANGTRLIMEGANSIRNGKEVFRQSNQHFWNALEALKGGATFPETILVAKSMSDYFVVADGHLRLTTYLLDPVLTPEKLEVILGLSENMPNWSLY